MDDPNNLTVLAESLLMTYLDDPKYLITFDNLDCYVLYDADCTDKCINGPPKLRLYGS